MTHRSRRSSSRPIRSNRRRKLAESRSSNDAVKRLRELMITDHTGVNKSAMTSSQAQGLAAGQPDQPESESRRREEPRPPEDPRGRGVRQSVRRSGGGVSPAGHRCARQDPDSRCNEWRTEGTADQGAAGFCCASEHAKRLQTSMGKGRLTVRTAIPRCGAWCGPVHPGLRPTGHQPEPKTHTVTIEGMRFQPETLTVALVTPSCGSTGTWFPRRRRLRPAASIRRTFRPTSPGRITIQTTGEFAYICTFHPTMKAMLRVRSDRSLRSWLARHSGSLDISAKSGLRMGCQSGQPCLVHAESWDSQRNLLSTRQSRC